MQCAILLQRRADGSYQASAPILPNLIRVAATRDEILQLMRTALLEAMTTTELIYLDMSEHVRTANPWLETSAMFHDDPTLETLLKDIYSARDAE